MEINILDICSQMSPLKCQSSDAAVCKCKSLEMTPALLNHDKVLSKWVYGDHIKLSNETDASILYYLFKTNDKKLNTKTLFFSQSG